MLFNHSTSPDPYAGSQGNGSSSCLVCHPINGRLQKQVLPIMGSPRYFVLHSSLNKLTVNTRAAQLSLQAPASQIKLPVVMTHPCVEDGSWLPVKPANTRWNSSTTAIDRVFASLNPGVRRVLTLPDTMGIKGLTKLLADNAPGSMKEETFESYFGRKIAIDASMSIYQFLIVVGRVGADTLTNEAGEVTSHLQGMFNRTIRLLEAGIKPVYVFDGKPPELKRQELNKRFARREDASENLAELKETGEKADIEKYSKRTVKVTKQHNEDCRRLLRLMGVPVIEAPSEAEAECAALCKAHKVHAVASEDMDSLTFGSPRFLRHLMEPASRKIPVMEYEISKILAELNLTMDQFIDMCILCGCDYCDTIRGIGAQTALKLIRQHGSLEAILENLNKDRYQITDPWPFEEARRLFKEPSVTAVEEQPELKWLPPDVEGLKKFLVDENGFNHDRVVKAIEKIKAAKNKASQGRLESFFKPSTIVSSKTKRNPDLQQSRTAAVHKRAKGAGRGSGKK